MMGVLFFSVATWARTCQKLKLNNHKMLHKLH